MGLVCQFSEAEQASPKDFFDMTFSPALIASYNNKFEMEKLDISLNLNVRAKPLSY